jgi:Ricin-type beta-trefoil lectin domain
VHKLSGRCLNTPMNHDAPLGAATIINCIGTTPPTLLQMFVIVPGGAIMTDESVCLDVRPSSENSIAGTTARLSTCTQLERQKWIYHKNVKKPVKILTILLLIEKQLNTLHIKLLFVAESHTGAQTNWPLSDWSGQ